MNINSTVWSFIKDNYEKFMHNWQLTQFNKCRTTLACLGCWMAQWQWRVLPPSPSAWGSPSWPAAEAEGVRARAALAPEHWRWSAAYSARTRRPARCERIWLQLIPTQKRVKNCASLRTSRALIFTELELGLKYITHLTVQLPTI